jgi:hypothetical protein
MLTVDEKTLVEMVLDRLAEWEVNGAEAPD